VQSSSYSAVNSIGFPSNRSGIPCFL